MTQINATAFLLAVGFKAYNNASAFVGNAWDLNGGLRLFRRGNWADLRGVTVEQLQGAGLVLGTDFRPGGTADSKLQIAWTSEAVAKYAAAVKAGKISYVGKAKATKQVEVVSDEMAAAAVEELERLAASM